MLRKKKTRGKYNQYTSKERATPGKFAIENGTQACIQKYKKDFKCSNESTVRRFKKNYQEEVAKRRRIGEDDEVKKLPIKKQGRLVILVSRARRSSGGGNVW